MIARTSRNTTIWMVILLVFAFIGFLIWLAWQFTFGGIGERRAIANLGRGLLSNHISVPLAELDIVAFQDGTDGWFVVSDTSQLEDVEIGFFGPRMMGRIFGGSHDPLHCSAGKSLYAVKNDNPVEELGYCSRRRMDLAELRPFAKPARWVNESVPVKEALPRIAAITQDPDQFLVETPHYYPDLDYVFTVTTPYYWLPQDSEATFNYITYDSLEEAFAATLPAGETRYKTYINYMIAYETPTVYDADWNATELSEPIIRVSGEDYTMPTLRRVARYKIEVHCIVETCPALTTVDTSTIFTPYRDRAVLDEAYATRTPTDYKAATMPPPSPVTLPDLADSTTTATKPALVLLDLSYVEAIER